MNIEETSKRLWRFLDDQRGAASIQELVDVLTMIALVAKQLPSDFYKVYNNGANYQLDALKKLISSLPKENKDIYTSPVLDRMNSSALAQIVYFVEEIRYNLHQLPQVIRTYLAENLRIMPELGNTESITKLFIELVGDASKKSLYDGTAGLAEIASAINPEKMILEEINHNLWVISYRLLLLEDRNPQFSNCDSLISSEFPAYENKVDLVVMQPPFGYRLQAHQTDMLAINADLLVVGDKKIPSSAGDVIWIQKAIRQLNSEGKAYLLLPIGWLFRGGYDAKVRDYLLDEDLIESIVTLPQGLLHGSIIQTSLLIINKAKLKGTPIYFIDATSMGKKVKKETQLSNEEIKLINKLATGNDVNHPNCTAVQIPTIRSQGKKGMDGNDLTPSRYFKTEQADLVLPDLIAESKKLKQLQDEFNQAQSRLNQLINIK